MRIIITEQQFNSLLLVENKKATDEEINEKYLGIVKYWNDIYEKTGELFNKSSTSHFLPLSLKINTDTNTKPEKQNPDYSWLRNNDSLDKFYIDTDHKQRQEKKQEEKKNEKYLGIVNYWNDIYKKTGELINKYSTPSSKINTDTNTKPKKGNPDYKWLINNDSLDKFYIDTDHEQRQEKKQKEIKQNEYKRLVDKYKNNPETFIANNKNLDYNWLNYYGFDLNKFYIDTDHKQRQEKKQKEIKQNEYKRLVDKYKNNPETFIAKNKNPDYAWLNYHRFDLNKFYEEIKYGKKESIGENIVKEILNNMSIKYIFNKGTYKCINEKGCRLRPDFTLKNEGVKIWIEYDGEQHFKKVRRSKNYTDETIENRFKTIVKNDIIKNQFCKSKNIKMIRISYKTNTYDGILKEIEKGLKSKELLNLSEDYPELGWNDPRLKNYTPNNTNF